MDSRHWRQVQPQPCLLPCNALWIVTDRANQRYLRKACKCSLCTPRVAVPQWRIPTVLLPHGRPLTTAMQRVVSTAYRAFSTAIEQAGDATDGSVVDVMRSAWDAVRIVVATATPPT